MKRLLLILLFDLSLMAGAQNPVMQWDFENIRNRNAIEVSSDITDTIEGNYEEARGIAGKGLRLDGFTTRVIRQGSDLKKPSGKEFTIEAWISLGEYPWNWCPIITTESEEVKGYRLMVGPLGQVSLETAIGEKWIACITRQEVLPLRNWLHIAAVYSAGKEMKVFVNSVQEAFLPIAGSMSWPSKTNCIIGMVAQPQKPSDIHRTWGTVAEYFGLDGIIDEIKVYDRALPDGQIKETFLKYPATIPDIAARKLPTIDSNPGRFGAFYTKLKYYPGWDNLWPVEQDPDIVVCFENSPRKIIFWRGTRYGAAWVSENENWMTDQSVEAWAVGENDKEGCFEHMQDRHCRFSHVRIIENTDARVVIHWRYAPVSAYDNTWKPDPKTNWECWIDEYYYIYPDGSSVRKVSWKKGSIGYPRQFQESLPLLHPGQMKSDLLYKDYLHVADYNNNIRPISYVENPQEQATDWARDFTIQQYNFKSENKPFICFEPGNNMSLRWNSLSNYETHSGCNHFPVGQARCDGRTSRMSDRPSHFDSFPISSPVIHDTGDREYWNGFYGMNEMSMTELVSFGRSWAYAPVMSVSGKNFVSKGYDLSQRCYQVKNTASKTGQVEISLHGTKESPVINPAIVIENWNSDSAGILVNGKVTKNFKVGVIHELEGDNLLIFIPMDDTKPVKITILPK